MDLVDLSGKTAVVTGGTRGIGLMIARGLLEAGARVYISSRKADGCAAAEAELSQYGPVTVNAVAPGPFESKMMAATLERFGDAIAEAAPLRRIGRPDDMAGVAVYLASRAGAYVTGAVIPVDGGIATTV